jgi:uncharacterized protein
MIIDADAHISPTPEGSVSIGIDELLRRMDRAGVDKALTWLQPPYLRHIDGANRYVYDAARAHPDRILPFGWADPNLGVEKAKATVRQCVEEYGFYGVKLNGAQNSFYIDDPRLSLPVIETIAAAGVLIAFHIGTDAFEATHPFRLGKIAAQFPDMRILMVHMGGVGFADLSNAAIETMQQHANITAIGSAVRAPHILKAVKTLGANRVCFGSDTPFELMHVEVAKYRALLEGEVSPEDQHAIMAGNIIRLFNLTDEAKS